MAGIYIHVPFCKTRCIYCDFYSTTRSEWKGRYIEALCKELEMRYTYLKGSLLRRSTLVEVLLRSSTKGFPESIRHRPPNLWDGELP